MQNDYKALFLRQSYLDNDDIYRCALQGKTACWDYVVLTASNEDQAAAYEMQIRHRLQTGFLPTSTQYLVVPDPEGKRCGSGGATLAVLHALQNRPEQPELTKARILCIHSGGDSKRVPQYSACGKIFSPVPRLLFNGQPSTLFDEFMLAMSGIPARIAGGMLVCSGDVLLLFNPLQLDFYGEGAAALSIKEKAETGQNHGVFLGADGTVRRFLHKQSVQTLTECGAVDKRGCVDIDTGAVIFSGELVQRLCGLIDTQEKYAALVNDRTRLSFYGDFLYPLAADSTLEDFYKEAPEGDFTPELRAAREQVWQALRGYPMKLSRFSPAAFLHFGTTGELLRLMTEEMSRYRFLNWSAQVYTNTHDTHYAVYNSYISRHAKIGKGCYIENADIGDGVTIGEGSVISGVTLQGVTIPAGVVLHGLKLTGERYVCRMYAVEDNPKKNQHLGKALAQPLWNTPLFTVHETMDAAVRATLAGTADATAISLQESFTLADTSGLLQWQDKLSDKVIAESILQAIDARIPADAVAQQYPEGISQRVQRYLLAEADKLDENIPEEFPRKIRIYHYTAGLIDREQMLSACYRTISRALLNIAQKGAQSFPNARICREETTARLPVRVNWGGGWSDTPPHCLEKGGTVLNAAILLDGEYPIEVTLKKLDKPVITLASTDIGSHKEFTRLQDLRSCGDPNDSFALHKAALMVCGIVPQAGDLSLEELCRQLGGGFYMNTRVVGIPKGSGLGTSSILAGACAKAISEFFGLNYSQQEMITRVLYIEQMMSTGGGWQDQVGGLVPGIKLVTAQPGLSQSIRYTPLSLSEQTCRELNDRMALIYTGQRRLARNLLRDVIGKYIGSDPTALRVLRQIQHVAEEMAQRLEAGDVDGFARLLSKHWELSQELDSGCTNTCIDQIFLSIEDLISGKMICGAGGGGFLQVIMKKGVTRQMLADRLESVFEDVGVCVYESTLLF